MGSKTNGHRHKERDQTVANESESPVPDSSRHEQIRVRAYEIYVERDRQPGNELSDWFQAEQELEAKLRSEREGK